MGVRCLRAWRLSRCFVYFEAKTLKECLVLYIFEFIAEGLSIHLPLFANKSLLHAQGHHPRELCSFLADFKDLLAWLFGFGILSLKESINLFGLGLLILALVRATKVFYIKNPSSSISVTSSLSVAICCVPGEFRIFALRLSD